jgi:hypothetical protein
MKRLLSIAALTTLSAAALLPSAAQAQTRLHVEIDSRDHRDHRYHNAHDGYRYAPPPPRHERAPRARPGYVWQPGHWVWHHNRHVWTEGHWLRERRGYVYVPSAWEERGGRHHYRESRWERGWHQGGRNGMPYWRERQDLDRDGIRDGYDRDLDNDGIANRHDRDVDGDGVRNRRDRRPDNPYHY